MKSEVKNKLNKIAAIWNNFIWEYKFCNRKIKFTEDIKTNYFGDILGYFHDTFDVVFKERIVESYADKFAHNISLLQAIYIHQDFIEELLLIFKCGIDKGELKKDQNYYINRDLRNELVGHPIRRFEGKFVSSTTFGYNSEKDSIIYLRYHKDNVFQFEEMSFKLSEIIKRHSFFLNTYFDIILEKLKSILTKFIKEIENLEKLIDIKDFGTVIKIVSLCFESIFKTDFIYEQDSLLKIYNQRNVHKRYQNLIDRFYNDLKNDLKEKKLYVRDLFEIQDKNINNAAIKKLTINIISTLPENSSQENHLINKDSYHYELGKLATKRNAKDFTYFSGFLKTKYSSNKLVLDELSHMESNIFNDIEYYSSYYLICSELKCN